MAQIAHDLAPGAALAFATAFTGDIAFAENIESLAKPPAQGGAGADVIVDDVIYFDEPFFQDGPIAAAVNKVTAGGAAYFSAAGNENLIDGKGRDIASWELPSFRDSSSCPVALAATGAGIDHCIDFNPDPEKVDSTFGITVAAGETLTLDLQWAEPWFGVATDLDVYLLNAEGNPLKVKGDLVESTSNNVGGEPFEFLQWENGGSTRQVQVAINRCSAVCNPLASGTATPRTKFVLLQNGGGITATEYPSSVGGDIVGPTIFGHSGTAGAISVAAVPFFNSSTPEEYSSRGPVTHYFGPVSGIIPASPLPQPETLSKPDIAATDCGVTTFFAFQAAGGVWRFCGTSAAAPTRRLLPP